MLNINYKNFVDSFFIVWEGTNKSSFYESIGSIYANNFCQVSEILPVVEVKSQHQTEMVVSTSPPLNNVDPDSHSLLSDTLEEIERDYSAEKISIILLSKCASWIDLDSHQGCIECQIAVATIYCSTTQCFLTLRKNVASGNEYDFHDILCWLSQIEQYFTAVNIALTLLDDVQTLNDLTGYDHNWSDNILDGIRPLYAKSLIQNARFSKDISGRVMRAFQSKWHLEAIELANMTVACLVKGGLEMSHALEGFLSRNAYFDTSEACLLLGAMSTLSVRGASRKGNTVGNSNSFCFNPVNPDVHIFWPIRCLLRVAVTRNCMAAALLLLNTTIPNEMRNNAVDGDLDRSIALCKHINKMIIAESPDSVSILLNLVEDGNGAFWSSISSATRYELSTLQVRGKYPFLLEAEVRQWAHELLSISTKSYSQHSVNEGDVPSIWLQNLCLACLQNAECDLSIFEIHTEINDLYDQFRNEEIVAIKMIDMTNDRIDFNLLIPSLLLLEKEQINWITDCKISTQSMLNIVSHIAGKTLRNQFLFAFDSKVATRQCASMGNISAAANLIGGNDLILLRCASVITSGKTELIQTAEEYLVGKSDIFRPPPVRKTDKGEAIADFVTDYHREILWYLDKYVLNSDKIGHYTSNKSNDVDPVFAATVCFRAWLSLCMNEDITSSGMWLENWLEAAIHDHNKKIGCAIIFRTLLWTDSDQKVTLAESLGLGNTFLVKLGLASPICKVNIM